MDPFNKLIRATINNLQRLDRIKVTPICRPIAMDIKRDSGTTQRPNRCIIRANGLRQFYCRPPVFSDRIQHFIPPPPAPPRLFLDFRERVRILFFNYTCVKERRGGGAASDRFIKVVWHIRSPRLLPRPRVDNAQKRDAGYIILFIISL